MYLAVVQRATASLPVKHLHLDECHISTISFHALRVLHRGKLDLVGLTCRLQLIATTVRTHSFQSARLVFHMVEGEQITVLLTPLTQRLTIEQQLHLIGSRDHIDGFYHSLVVVPMTYNIGARHLVVHPSAPHHLMGVEGILRYSHGIGDATGPIVGLTAMVRVGVREYNLHPTRRHACSCSWTLQPVVVPATYHLDSEVIHVVVIVRGRLSTI